MNVDKKVKLNTGYLVSFIIITIALFGWMIGFNFSEYGRFEALAITFAKMGAFGGLAMFAWSLILSGRYSIFDRLFHGLDKMYIAHRFFGSLGLVLLVLHPLALTLALIPERGLEAFGLWARFDSLALGLGYVSLYGMIAIIVWSVSARVKHETFIIVHKFLGILFFAGVAHAYLAGSVLASSSFMFWYIGILSATSLLTYLHYSVFSDMLHPHYTYKVASVKQFHGGVTDVRLRTSRRVLNFKAGQFVYISFDFKGTKEYHPFTIASGSRTSELQLVIKEVGDFTKQLAKMPAGTVAKVKGPYGGFTFDQLKSDRQLWIAGGIGITPFLSKARSLPHSKKYPEIELVYATKTKQEAEFALKELRDIKRDRTSFNFIHISEDEIGIVGLQQLQQHFRKIDDFVIHICGPPPMLKAYQKQAEALGLADRLFYEEFSF